MITFETGEDTTSVVCGFTITQGNGTIIPGTNYRAGGGILFKVQVASWKTIASNTTRWLATITL